MCRALPLPLQSCVVLGNIQQAQSHDFHLVNTFLSILPLIIIFVFKMNMMVAVSCNRFLFFKLGDTENKKELKVMEPLAIERGQTIPLMPRRQWKAKGVSFFFEMFSLFMLVCMGGGSLQLCGGQRTNSHPLSHGFRDGTQIISLGPAPTGSACQS